MENYPLQKENLRMKSYWLNDQLIESMRFTGWTIKDIWCIFVINNWFSHHVLICYFDGFLLCQRQSHKNKQHRQYLHFYDYMTFFFYKKDGKYNNFFGNCVKLKVNKSIIVSRAIFQQLNTMDEISRYFYRWMRKLRRYF